MEARNPDQPRCRPFRRVWVFEESYRGKTSSPVCLICAEKPLGFVLDEDTLCPTCGMLLNWFRSRFADKGFDIRMLTAQTTFRDLSTDSLDCIEWVMEAETQFGVVITEADAEKLQTVGDFLGYIRAHEGGKSPKGPTPTSSHGADAMWDQQMDG